MMRSTWIWLVFLIGLVCAYKRSTVVTCLWHDDKCVDECPEWMVENKSNCSESYWPAQRTCDRPELMLVGTVCGFSRCDCPPTMVLDTDTGYCYDVDNCPMKHDVF